MASSPEDEKNLKARVLAELELVPPLAFPRLALVREAPAVTAVLATAVGFPART